MAIIFYRDMELICRSCGAKFIFTAGEQEFYADKGFLHEPTRCPKCRNRREAVSLRRRAAAPLSEDEEE
jgi:ssDNA-binding Zn-finger/Zn-ribbon topoisomerase 1